MGTTHSTNPCALIFLILTLTRHSLIPPHHHHHHHHASSTNSRTGLNGGKVSRFMVAATFLLAASSSSIAYGEKNTKSFCTPDDDDDNNNHSDELLPQEMLTFDTYNGVIIKIADKKLDENNNNAAAAAVAQDTDHPNVMEDHDFHRKLQRSLDQWRGEEKRGIWVHVPTRYARLVPICTSLGFDFHSCQPGMVVMTQWLPRNVPSRLPLGPTHQVGIGALVLNSQGEMLVVQEKTGPASAYRLWKMPTGLLDPGEDIRTAAKRELKEETGLDANLVKVVCFRQAHLGGDRGSDLFYICLMSLNDPTQEIVAQEEEIAAVKWMDMEEFSSQEIWQSSPIYMELNRAMMEAVRTPGAGMQDVTLPVGFRPGTNTIYIPSSI